MADELTCNLCGGKDFYKEDGYYYCNECQTQSQELVEHVFDMPEEYLDRSKMQKVKKDKKRKVDQITSWECYNIILLGLVEELTQLGAREDFKELVQVLWFKYLKLLEVVHEDPDATPKLQAYHSKRDSQIIYGRPLRKKRKYQPTNASSNGSEVTSFSLNRIASKRKKELAKAEYSEFSSQQSDGVSVTLSSLKSSETTANKSELLYTATATKQLLGLMSQKHLNIHLTDTEDVLKCHKVTRKQCTVDYVTSSNILNKCKLYAILYLALLINEDDIQLGDLIRFINESHLSYNRVEHFFPEEFEDKELNLGLFYQQKRVFQHSFMRHTAAKLFYFLSIEDCVPLQNLQSLCKRYCQELNLPEEIKNCVISLINMCQPEMKLLNASQGIPNYEARAISFIIFVMKLLFGLDGTTEHKLSVLAQTESRNFIFNNWLQHIYYRNLVLAQHHFPIHFQNNQNCCDPETYLNFMLGFYQNLELERNDCLEYDVIENLLDQLGEKPQKSISFDHSLTPCRDYLKRLLDSDELSEYNCKILESNFSNCNLDFLKDYCDEDYLENVSIVSVVRPEKPLTRNSRELFIKTKLVSRMKDFNESFDKPKTSVHTENVKHGYWLYAATDFEHLTIDDFEKYFNTLPDSFQLMVQECARVIRQSSKDLMEEFIMLELHLCYNFNVSQKSNVLSKLVQNELSPMIKRAFRLW